VTDIIAWLDAAINAFYGKYPCQVLVEAKAEIERLQKIHDGTERREAEYLALIEKHATENDTLSSELTAATALLDLFREDNERLKAERHTTKQLLEDVLKKYYKLA
jgi:hypothetical protein